MLDIYKRLPGTNCGKCGVPTCMAFAQKVKKNQLNIRGCPYVSEEDKDLSYVKPKAAIDDNYERVSKDLEREAKVTNFKEVADAIGGLYEIRNGSEIIRIKMTNKFYKMSKEGLFEGNGYCQDSWSKIIIYDYILRKGKEPLTGEWVTLGYFPNTASHVKAFQSGAEKKISETFSKDFDSLKLCCQKLGGSEDQGRMKADYICRFDILPRIPLYLCFWKADEEFDASCKLFLDSNADAYIDIEYLAYLVERFVEFLTNKTS
jgi:hypothetical protein